MDINDVCDYTIVRLTEASTPLNLLKLQKLLYYIQAWHLAFKGTPLFPGRFQAWVHGPVNREIYERFKETKSLYSSVSVEDIQPTFDDQKLPQEAVQHINSILNEYAGFSGDQLEELSHLEDPWIEARKGYRPTQRCEEFLDEALMGEYYRRRLQSA